MLASFMEPDPGVVLASLRGLLKAEAIRPAGIPALSQSASSAWDLLLAVTVRDIRVRYQGTFLSYIWWIARPLLMGLVLFFALGEVLRLDIPNYAAFLMAGLFPWQWFAGSVGQGASAFTGNGGLLKKVRFPRIILPLSAVLFNTTQFLMTIPVTIIFVLASGLDLHASWLIGIPVLLVIQLLLVVGVSTLLASVSVFFRDLGPLLDIALMLMFYMTPIIYPIERVPDRFEWLMKINPMAPLIEAWRELFLFGSFPDVDIWPALLLTAVTLVLGMFLFRRLEGHFADAL
jgi:lipopolysaccharide transport system permease protein